MNETDDSIVPRILEIFRKLPPHKQEQLLDFVEFLIWKEESAKENAKEN